MNKMFFLIFLVSVFVPAQQKPFDALNKLFEKDGLDIYFIYYNEGNGVKDNGVVIYLRNRNDYSVSYNFKLNFRSGKIDKINFVEGKLKPLEERTGSNDGLYFIPFEDKRTITEVGISGCRVEKI